jgi:hypothetical protein
MRPQRERMNREKSGRLCARRAKFIGRATFGTLDAGDAVSYHPMENVPMNGRYTALPMISMGLRILGYIVLVLGVLTAVYYLIFGQPVVTLDFGSFQVPKPGFIRGHLVPAFWALIDSGIRALLLVGAAELIHVMLDIEENTRGASGARRADIAGSELP